MWGLAIAAFSIVPVVLWFVTVRRLAEEERRPYGILLGILVVVYAALCITVVVMPNENLWIIGSNALLSLVTLYLIRFARIGEGTEAKLWAGIIVFVFLLFFACIYTPAPSPAAPAADSTQETAVTVFSAFLMAHAAGLLELYLFGKKRRVVQLERYTVEHQSKKETIHYEE